jgi:hypothetical protein
VFGGQEQPIELHARLTATREILVPKCFDLAEDLKLPRMTGIIAGPKSAKPTYLMFHCYLGCTKRKYHDCSMVLAQSFQGTLW